MESALLASGTPRPRWHFTGRLQRNKARHVAAHFDLIETLDRTSLGDELDRRAAAAQRRIEALIQVDLCDEPQKGGVSPEELPALLEKSARWSALRVVGLMAIPRATPDPVSDTRYSERPASSRAATTAKSATSPSATGSLVPVIRPDSQRAATASTPFWPGFSVSA